MLVGPTLAGVSALVSGGLDASPFRAIGSACLRE